MKFGLRLQILLLLGGLMLDQRAWDQIADVVHGDDLYRADHRLIFGAIAELIGRDQPPDAVTVAEHLQRSGQLEAAGGVAYLARLVEDTTGRGHTTRVHGNQPCLTATIPLAAQ